MIITVTKVIKLGRLTKTTFYVHGRGFLKDDIEEKMERLGVMEGEQIL